MEGASFAIDGDELFRIFYVEGNGILTVNNLTLKNGRSFWEGGAIYNLGTLTVNNSSFSNNRALVRGGAIYNTGTLSVNRSAFNGNRATPTPGYLSYGGAIAGNLGGTISVTNSTFYENRAEFGGAIHQTTRLTVTNSTFVGNVVTYAYPIVGAAIHVSSGNLLLRNSIISGNSGGHACYLSESRLPRESVNNYVGDGTCEATYSSGDGPINLGALTGSPAYYPLLAGSVAIDAADSNYCPTIDQAGTARPIGNGCDIGAHETTALPPPPTPFPTGVPTHTVTPTPTITLTPTFTATRDPLATLTVNGSCSLADAITAANTDTATGGCIAGSGADTITLSAAITLSATLPKVASPITIEGASYSISGADSHRIFYVESNGDLTVNNSTLVNGRTSFEGGAIFNHGRLRVNNSTFSNNRALERGGAISNKGTLIINSSTFNGNRATATSDAGFGGAIKGWSGGTISITNSTFYENRARFGGAIHHNSSLTLTNSTFVGNVSAFGSAIRSSGGFLWLRSSIFSGNSGGPACYHSKPDRLTSGFDNYVDDGSCGETYTSDDGPINLGALTGSPAYYPLLAGSLAIDAADNNYCPATDQAGTARPIGNGCDIGSHETTAEPPMRTATATATITHTSTATATATTTPTAATDTPAAPESEFCVFVGPGAYWLFTGNRFLSGYIPIYPGSNCEHFEITETSIGDNGYVYTSAGQAAAAALCAAGHNDGSTYTVMQQAFNTDVWQCTPLGSQGQQQAATDTPAPPISSQGVYGLTLASNSAGELQVSWDAPGQSPNDYRVNWAKVGEALPDLDCQQRQCLSN